MSSSYNLCPSTLSSLTLHTSLGPLTISLFPKQLPAVCTLFVNLCNSGYYDGAYVRECNSGGIIISSRAKSISGAANFVENCQDLPTVGCLPVAEAHLGIDYASRGTVAFLAKADSSASDPLSSLDLLLTTGASREGHKGTVVVGKVSIAVTCRVAL